MRCAGRGREHGNLHRREVLSAPAAYLERVHVAETRKDGHGFFCVERGGEGEGEDVEPSAGAEEGEDGVGRERSPCGTGVLFGADGEGSDVLAVLGGDMADEGVEGRGRGEGHAGEDRGEAEGTGSAGGGGEGADGGGGEEEDDGEAELGGEEVPGHVGGRGGGGGGYLYGVWD